MIPFAIAFPNIDPNLLVIPGFELFGLALGPFPIRWYALSYIAGLVLGWWWIRRLMTAVALWPGARAPMTRENVDDLLTWMTIAVVLGGRMGYVLFYETQWLWEDPYRAIAIWEGGMAFHGGMLGVVVAVLLFARSIGASPLSIGDAVACAAPFGLLFGRIANFINAELWGRVTDQPWGMIFPTVESMGRALAARTDELGRPMLEYQAYGAELLASVGQPRHPSQLYEAALEGLVLLALLGVIAYRSSALKKPGFCVGVFLVGYGVARGMVEFWRQPDIVKNVEILGAEITRGQLLSLPMIFVGIAFLVYAQRSAGGAAARA